jgi:signal transduction histidine kinase
MISFEHRFNDKSGNAIWVYVTGKAIDDSNMNKGILWSFSDITREKTLEEFKKNVNQIMHHDLRSPVSGIIAMADQVLNKYVDSEEYEKYFLMIKDIGKNMINQLNMFLAVSMIEEGIYRYNPVRVDILDIIRATLKMLDSISNFTVEKNIEVMIAYNGVPADENLNLFINSDANLINCIMINLIKNAIEASPEDKCITISIIDADEFVISVHNFGAIPQSIRNNFFMKFNTAGKSGGTGLGAYSIKLMSETLGAKIFFETDDEKGTSISINFGGIKKSP